MNSKIRVGILAASLFFIIYAIGVLPIVLKEPTIESMIFPFIILVVGILFSYGAGVAIYSITNRKKHQINS